MQTELTKKAYLYYQYQDDLDLKLIMDVHNDHLQAYLDAFNELNLPIYTQHTGLMLDWVAKGIYGFDRPTIATGESTAGLGLLNNQQFNALEFNCFINGSTPGYQTLTDDEFKRLLHWHLFLGDDFIFNVEWLKRRIKRFISDWFIAIDDISNISITLPSREFQAGMGFLGFTEFNTIQFNCASTSINPLIDAESTWIITITTTSENKVLAETFKWLVYSDRLALPINNKYEVIVL